MTTTSFAFWLFVCMCIITLTSPYRPDMALVIINSMFALGCAIEGFLIVRSE